MNKPGWLLTQTATKGLVLILVLGLSLGACPRSFAQDDDPGLLNQQQNKLYQEGKYQEAIPIAEKLLAIRKRVLGPNHPDTASTLSDLAVLYYKTGDYTKAEPLFRRALQIREKVLGPEHPDTATSLNNLAELYRVRGDYAKAEPLYQQALQIDSIDTAVYAGSGIESRERRLPGDNCSNARA